MSFGSVTPPVRDNSFTTSSRTVEAFIRFDVLGCFRPDVAFLRPALGFHATFGLSAAGSVLRADQIRVTATSRDSNFLTGFTPGRPL
jgi:hypothetical protein